MNEKSTTISLKKLLKNKHFSIPLLVFITGASGAGKTTTLKTIESELGDIEGVGFYYFDQGGVPSLSTMVRTYGSGERWQEVLTHRWIDRMIHTPHKNLLFLEGSFNPDFALSYLQHLGIKRFLFVCLDVRKSSREERLLHQRGQPELVNAEMENWAQFLKNKTLKLGGVIVSSNEADVRDIACKVLEEVYHRLK